MPEGKIKKALLADDSALTLESRMGGGDVNKNYCRRLFMLKIDSSLQRPLIMLSGSTRRREIDEFSKCLLIYSFKGKEKCLRETRTMSQLLKAPLNASIMFVD